uniref:Uncharacterized protein n=1 Tax=Setaria italica TaxID=4555 RepID=A0A0Q3TL46_SETIT
APVAPLLRLLVRRRVRTVANDGPDAVDRRQRLAGADAAPEMPERLHGAGLQRLERVHHDAIHVGDAPPDVDHGAAQVLLRVLEQLLHEVRRRDRRDAGELQRRVPELLEALPPAGEQRRQLRDDGEEPGARGEEGVGGDAELSGDLGGVGGEHAGDDGVQAAAREGAEEARELAVVPPQQLENVEERGLAGSREVGGRRVGREEVERDGRVGGDDKLGGGGAGVGGPEGTLDEHHGDVEAAAEEDLGELRHGDDVALAEARVHHHGLSLLRLGRHGVLLLHGRRR